MEKQLNSKSEFFIGEGSERTLNKHLVSQLAREYDSDLLILLRSSDVVRKWLFVPVQNVEIFKLETFLAFVNNHGFLPDNFSAYENKIGLAVGNKYLDDSQDVVLNWKYKDCILEGGQTKEDQKQRQEIYFNEVLAPDQINRLLDDKVFVNWKKYDKDGEHTVSSIENTDNLIIKGNNLVVLHSLKKRFAGRVKLIYIDPPYYFPKKIATDTFKYNSNFKLSTWLTFMKNRLEVAKELLDSDGVLYLHIDWNGVHYLKLLGQQIFGKFQTQIVLRREVSRGRKAEADFFGHNADYILVFTKTETGKYEPQTVKEEIKDLKDYKKDDNGYFSTSDPGSYTQESLISFYDEGLLYITKNGKAIIDRDNRTITTTTGTMRIKYYLKEIEGKFYKEKYIDDIWDDITPIASLPGERMGFDSQKPEELIERIINASTEKKDIVLDFFLGSGTTAAVAHRMKRQYIGIEQMDYIESKVVEGMKKVISGKQRGNSKSVNMEGGSFVYCELANDSENFKKEVDNARSDKELLELLEKAKNSSFLSWRVETDKLNGFENLTIEQKKKILEKLVDDNTLYINYTDIDSEDYNISEQDKKLNREFYGID